MPLFFPFYRWGNRALERQEDPTISSGNCTTKQFLNHHLNLVLESVTPSAVFFQKGKPVCLLSSRSSFPRGQQLAVKEVMLGTMKVITWPHLHKRRRNTTKVSWRVFQPWEKHFTPNFKMSFPGKLPEVTFWMLLQGSIIWHWQWNPSYPPFSLMLWMMAFPSLSVVIRNVIRHSFSPCREQETEVSFEKSAGERVIH